MKITIITNKFKKGLSVVEKIASKNLNFPILENVLMQTEKNFLSLISTDLEIALKYWILAKIEKEGKITLPVKLLSNFVNFIEEENLNLETKNHTLVISTQNNVSKFLGQDPEEFPILPKIEKEKFVEIERLVFTQGLSQVVDFTSLSQIRPEISGVYFNFQPNCLNLVATDSFRLAEKTISYGLNIKKPPEKEYSFILPQKAARQLTNILSKETLPLAEEKLKIYFSKNQVLFEIPMEGIAHPEIHLISRLIEGDYPNYKEIIPQKYDTKIIIQRDVFLNQIRASSIFSGKINDIQISTFPQRREIEILSKSPEIGETKTVLPAKIDGKESKVSFNFRFLIDGLSNMKSKDITFELNGEEGPAVLRPVGDPSYLYVVMPIKTS